MAMMRSVFFSSFGRMDAAIAPMKPSSSAREQHRDRRRRRVVVKLVEHGDAPRRSRRDRRWRGCRRCHPSTRPSPWSNMPIACGGTFSVSCARGRRMRVASPCRGSTSNGLAADFAVRVEEDDVGIPRHNRPAHGRESRLRRGPCRPCRGQRSRDDPCGRRRPTAATSDFGRAAR